MFRTESYHCLFHSSWLATCQISYNTATVVYTLLTFALTWWAESLHYLQISYATTTVVYSLLIFALTWWAESLHYLLWVFVFGFNLFLWWTHCYFGLITIKLVTIYFNDDHVSIVGLVAIKLFINYRFTPVSFLLQLYQVCVVNFIANLLNCSPHFFFPLLSSHYSPAEFIGHYWKGGNVSVWLIHSV